MSDHESTPTPSETCPGCACSGELAVDKALARAVVWRFLSLGFAPPARGLLRALAEDQEREALAAALALLELPPFPLEGPSDLAGPFEELFGHTVRARVCPYETEYGDGQVFLQAQELADLFGWYAAFGLERRPDLRERADHIAMECEFAGFLSHKEAYAVESGDCEQPARVRQAYRRFLRDHLARFGTVVATHLEREDPEGFYGRLGGLLGSVLASECRRIDVQPGPSVLPLRTDELDMVPAACGTEQDCSECDPPRRGD